MNTPPADEATTFARRLVPRVVVAFFSVVAGIAAIVSTTFIEPFVLNEGITLKSTWYLSVIFAVVAIVLFVAYLRLTLNGQGLALPEERQPFETATVPPQLDESFRDLVQMAYKEFDRSWAAAPGPGNQAVEHAYVFSQVIIDPKTWISRITEWVEPQTATQKVTTNFTVSLPDSVSGRLVIPLIPTGRGTIVNGLKLSGSDGRISTLTRVESIAYACAVIRFLASRLYRKALSDYDATIADDVMILLLDQKQYLPDHTAMNAITTRDTDLRRIKKRFAGLLGKVRRSRRPTAEGLIDVILYMISGLLDSDYVCAEIDLPEDRSFVRRSVRLSVEQIEPKQQVTGVRGSGFRQTLLRHIGLLRAHFGVQTTIYQHSLARAALASSYHAHITGPQGTYLARQNISIRPGSLAIGTPSSGSVSMQARTGQRKSHLYIRDAQHDYAEAVYANHFYERPPGSVAAPLLSAFAALVVTALCAVKGSLLTDATGPNVDLLAILLAFPTVIALWVGVGEGARPSLFAYGSKFLTILGSIVAAFLYTLGTDETPHLAVYWTWICGSLLLNVVACTVSLVSRSTMHGRISASHLGTEENVRG